MAALAPPSSIDALLQLHQLTLSSPEDPNALGIALAESEEPSISSSDNEALQAELAALSDLSRDLLRSKMLIPPPPKPQPNQRSTLVARAREEGNAAFKKGNPVEAHLKYSIATQLALTRPVYEAAVYARDELAVALSNRATATMAMIKGGAAPPEMPIARLDWALEDAKAVVKIKKQWPKGHFKLGKVWQEMGELQKAKESFELGLDFEPDEQELQSALKEINELIKSKQAQAAAQRNGVESEKVVEA